MSYRKKVQISYCEVCGFDNTNAIEVHHIEEQHITKKKIGKADNNPYNLISLCSNHHSLIHSGDILINRKVKTTNGYELMWKEKDDLDWTIGVKKPV